MNKVMLSRENMNGDRMITLGSLFDGAGTVPLDAEMCGIIPVWSSEIEKFPREVTAKRFPNTKQLGDITKIDGRTIPAVDVIAGGSPCQDVSVAGRRAGIGGERSGLFFEMIRIIKEMRDETSKRADEPVRPRYAVWENVPYAQKHIRNVLEEFCKVKDHDAAVPRPAQGGEWQSCGCIVGDGYSVAWRVLDARFWGVLSAAAVGAVHKRERVAIIAHTNSKFMDGIRCRNSDYSRRKKSHYANHREKTRDNSEQLPGFPPLVSERNSEFIKPLITREDDGFSNAMDRNKALGNAVVPQCFYLVFKAIYDSMKDMEEL